MIYFWRVNTRQPVISQQLSARCKQGVYYTDRETDREHSETDTAQISCQDTDRGVGEEKHCDTLKYTYMWHY